MSTKLNVNIRMLLSNCEDLAKSEDNFWRLQKFIKSLDSMIAELQAMDDTQSMQKIETYMQRVKALKLATNYPDTSSSTVTTNNNNTDSGDNAMKEIRQLQNTKHFNELRKDLLQDDDNLRLRKMLRSPEDGAANGGSAADNMNEAVKYYNNAQVNITEHMMSLARNLKEQTETANRIIRSDTEVVSKSTNMADRNINSLGKEAEKLDQHSRKAYKCWLWLMIVFVIVVFIGMVLFMKIMKKKKV